MADTKLSAIATEAANSVGDERLYIVDNLAGTPASKYIKIGDVIYSSASAPTSPEDNFLWHETDTGIIWRYGTYASASRWVSVSPFVAGVVAPSLTGFAASLPGMVSINSIYDIYVESISAQVFVITTNNGSNYWTINVRKVTTSTQAASAAGTLIGGFNTSAISANSWTQLTTSPDSILDVSAEAAFYDVLKTSAPGNLQCSVSMLCRFVHA